MKEAYRELNEHIIPSKQLTQNVLEQVSSPSKRLRPLTVVAAVLAVAVLVLLPLMPQQRVYASVYMTINPQVRIDVRSDDTVIGLQGLNSDGEELIAGYTFRQKTLELVLDELVERAVDMGYLHTGGNISLEVEGQGPRWGNERSEELKTQVNQYLMQEISDSIADELVSLSPEEIDPANLAAKLGIHKGITTTGHTSTNATILFGASSLAYDDGRIYYNHKDSIYEYTIGTGITAKITVGTNVWAPLYLSEDGSRIIFNGERGLESVSKDGSDHAVLHGAHARGGSYWDGNDFYYMEYMADSLFYTDLETGQTNRYFTYVNTFFVTEDSIYVCARDDALNDEELYLFKASREDMVFEKVKTEMHPIAVCAYEDDIFYAKSGRSWYIYHMADGVETKLPIRSWCFQAIGDSVIYVDQKQNEQNQYVLKAYNWKNCEEILLYEGDSPSFCILADRYLYAGSGVLIDLYTGTTTRMLR